MIISNLPVLLAERRLKVVDVARATSMSKTTLHKLYNEQSTRIDFETIDKLCDLLNVGVGDLLKYVPNQKNGENENSGLVSK
jgi:putative transcriptional regulator